MNPFHKIAGRLRSIIQQRTVRQEIDEELRFHLEQRTAENIGAGMPPEDAAREARQRFGNLQNCREDCRQILGLNFGESVAQDIRYGLRSLAKNPGFTATAVLTLALGIGGVTAIYSVINTVLLHPIPGPHPERLVQIAEELYTQGSFKEQNNKPFFDGVSPPVLEALLRKSDFFSEFAWYDSISLDRKTEDFAEIIQGWAVSSNFFRVWKVAPLLGRTFAPDEAVPLNENDRVPIRDTVIVLSYSLWKEAFGGDPSIIGKAIEMSSRHLTVIGVMPSWFQPEGSWQKFWVASEPSLPRPNYTTLGNIRVVAHLRPEATQQEAKAMLDVVAAQLKNEYPANVRFGYGRDWSKRPHGLALWIRPFSAGFLNDEWSGAGRLQRTLFGLLGAIVFILLIVCANTANLTLARTERRRHELAIRASIGAGRGRLARQLLTESLLLAGLGGLGGVAVSVWGIELLLSLVPASMPRLQPVAVDGHALAYALIISLGAGVMFGLVPALSARRVSLNEALKQSGSGATVGAGRGHFRGALVVAEVALAIVLLAGAGLMIKSVILMLHVEPGFDPENLARVNFQLPWKNYNDQDHPEHAAQLRKVLYGQLQERLAALPGVRAVGIGKHGAWPLQLKAEGQSQPVEMVFDGCGVGPGDLFRAMRVPLLTGRLFETSDLGEGVGTAIINESMARAVWPDENAVGKKFGPYRDQTFQVIGVVGDIRDYRYDQPLRPTFFRPCDELSLEGMAPFVVIRAQSDPRKLIPAIRRELKAAEPEMRAPGFTIESQVLYDSTAPQRTYMTYLVVFAGAGLFLCAIGIYGVLSYTVARRGREIGIRIAVGAQRGDILSMIISEGLRLVTAGLALGLLAAFWLTRLLQSQLFHVSPGDPGIMAAVVLFLLVAAVLACYIPARRATKIDPMTALRCE
jgi:putative ABC transport system permease protein